VSQIDKLIEELIFKESQKQNFKDAFSGFETHINNLFSEFEYELVMYDEVEYFKKYTHPEFYYPFQKRKTKMGTFTLDITLDKDTYDYDYYSKTVSFQQS
jgi:hypothetical protein